MQAAKLSIQGNSLVGLYIIALDDKVLIGSEVPESMEKELESVFQAPIVRLTLAGTSLLGVFAATDGKQLLIPDIIFPHEEAALNEAGLTYHKISTVHTCLGNNLIFTEKAMFAHPEFEVHAIEQIKRVLNIPIEPLVIDGSPAIGSFVAHNGERGVVSHDVSQQEYDKLQSHLGLQLTTGTVNMGSLQIHSGLAMNKHGFVIGEASGGPELVNVDQALTNHGEEDES